MGNKKKTKGMVVYSKRINAYLKDCRDGGFPIFSSRKENALIFDNLRTAKKYAQVSKGNVYGVNSNKRIY